MSDHYILVGQTAVPVEADPYSPEGIAGLIEWGRWLEDADRRVAFTRVMGMCYVSTIFLGLDHRYGRGRPVLFESMVFWAGQGGEEQDRCSTWLEAEDMHRRMVEEASSPRAVLRYVGRAIGEAIQEAVKDWRRGWREFRGLGPERTGDPIWDAALDSMESIEKRMMGRRDSEWMIYG